MRTKYEFEREVGQVAGGNIKSNTVQAHVDLHIHHGVDPTPVSDRQRNAIARKAFEIESKTGTDKLMVYRRLMSVFNFESMDTLPREKYARVMSYLDGWLRNGMAGQTAAPRQPQRPAGQGLDAPGVRRAPAPTSMVAELRQPMFIQSSMLNPGAKKLPWRVVCAGVLALAGLAVGAYAMGGRLLAPTLAPVVAPVAPRALQCEYGGARYTIGSIVMQAGMRQQCVAAGEHAAWEQAPSHRR
jgi:hypothetical protein